MKEREGGREAAVHAKLMVKDGTDTPAEAELGSIETQFTLKRTRSMTIIP